MLGRRFFPFGAKGIFSGGHLLVLGRVCNISLPSLFSQPLLCDCFLQVTETGGSSVSVAWLRRGSEKVGEVQILLHFDYPFGMVEKNCGDIFSHAWSRFLSIDRSGILAYLSLIPIPRKLNMI